MTSIFNMSCVTSRPRRSSLHHTPSLTYPPQPPSLPLYTPADASSAPSRSAQRTDQGGFVFRLLEGGEGGGALRAQDTPSATTALRVACDRVRRVHVGPAQVPCACELSPTTQLSVSSHSHGNALLPTNRRRRRCRQNDLVWSWCSPIDVDVTACRIRWPLRSSCQWIVSLPHRTVEGKER